MPAVLQRPHSLSPELARPPDERREARGPNLDRPLAQQFAGRRRDRGDRVRALVAVRTEHDHCLVHLQCDCLDARRTRLAWGDATLLICAGPRRQARGLGFDRLGPLAAAVRARGWWYGSCARGRPALSRSAVPLCGRAGDMMVDGVIPLGEALRPLGLSGPSTLAWRQERAGSRPRRIG